MSEHEAEQIPSAPPPPQPTDENSHTEIAETPQASSKEDKTVDVDAFFKKADGIQIKKVKIHDVLGENGAGKKDPGITQRAESLLRKLDDHEIRLILEAQGKEPDEIDAFLEEAHEAWDAEGSEENSDTTIALQYIQLLRGNRYLAPEQIQHVTQLIEGKIGERGAKTTTDTTTMPAAELQAASEKFLNGPLENLQELAKTDEGKKKVKKLIEELRAAIPAMGDYVVKNATIDSFINFVLTGESHSYGTSVFEMEKRGQAFIDEETLGEAPFYNNPDACREYAENTLLHLEVLDEETKRKIRATRPPMDPAKIPQEFLSDQEGEEKKLDREKYSKWLREKFADVLMQQREAMQKQMKKELFAKGVRKGKKLEKGEATQVEYGSVEEFDEKVEISSEFIRKLLSII